MGYDSLLEIMQAKDGLWVGLPLSRMSLGESR